MKATTTTTTKLTTCSFGAETQSSSKSLASHFFTNTKEVLLDKRFVYLKRFLFFFLICLNNNSLVIFAVCICVCVSFISIVGPFLHHLNLSNFFSGCVFLLRLQMLCYEDDKK